jgi:hypothetical protein
MFAIESWAAAAGGGREWRGMHTFGGARATWRPRKTDVEAIEKARKWTGYIGIPSMRVVDETTGDVVWADTRHADSIGGGAGSCVNFDPDAPIYQDEGPRDNREARAQLRRELDQAPAFVQEALF